MTPPTSLRSLRIATLRIRARARDALRLPRFAGSTLRGAFGHALFDTACATGTRDCAPCALRERCAVPYVFETPIEADDARLPGVPFAPHPFAFDVAFGGSRLRAGAPFSFGLTLFGRATEYVPTFAAALARTGERGLTGDRSAFDVVGIDGLTEAGWAELASGDPLVLDRHATRAAIKRMDAPAASGSRLRVTLRTPLRLAADGRLARLESFHELMRACARRAKALLAFHEGIDVSFDAALDAARSVRTVVHNLRRVHAQRWSQRQGRRMQLDGWLGRVEFEGDFGACGDLLAFASNAGVGKSTAFGFGRLALRWESA
ncbi:MAG: CRISPR system precrRNA processing endoribonuclease RAMP protein Cas6 [Planctomycetes bacterium]|nr:CRISPR system precrRNA processing endoribonuclease RAMP protein Cas6 [Planctomycetota bacterium]MCC7169378.1 CRISPR system precrRNA processing endoribonuclease RAMP protein Cas6 [Planctomycetota bacterium]